MIRTRPAVPAHTALGAVAKRAGADLLAGRRVDVTGITVDSRAVEHGDLFVAPAGATTHGARFASQAAKSGAVAVLTDPEGARILEETRVGLPVLVVPSPRAVLGDLSAFIYGDPAHDLRLFGVTGTQGKTTTTRLAEAALTASGSRSAVVGTVGTRIAGEDVPSALTTPEAPALHALFGVMRENEVDACAMEVSSHALVMGRVDGVVFDVAAFTNLGRDHLDFHTDMDDYFEAKAQLFTPERARSALVNADDPYGRRLIERAEIPTRSFAREGDAHWVATDVVATGTGSRFTLHGPGGDLSVEVPLPGDFNVSNAVCAIAGLAELGFDAGLVAEGLARAGGVPGRMEAVDEGQDFTAVVDYAHKPDAVEAVLRSVRGGTPGRIIIVIGAGGDRDRGKRPVMGEIAAQLADVVVVTDDNPRSEDPAAIRAEVLAGASGATGDSGATAEVHEVGDRREAIRLAVSLARSGDCLVVAGKGHETGQEVGGHKHPFDDRDELRAALQAVAR